jgi:AcrR family transcriptional regulator
MGRPSNAAQRRTEIVQALYDCLAAQGHEKVTIKAIAARAGLPYRVIHYYFNNKDEIIARLAQTLVTRYGGMLDTRLAAARTKRGAIDAALDFVVDELIFNHGLNRVFFNLIQMAFERASLHQVMTELFRAYRQRMVNVLQAAGVGKPSVAIGTAVVALAEGFALQWMIEPGVFSKREVKAALVKMVGEVA